jgi:hypothetical protein
MYASLFIIREIKSRRMRWMEHVHVWERGKVYVGFWWGNHMESPGIDGR